MQSALFGAWFVQIRKQQRSTIIRLHYDRVNRGEFLWSHDRAEGNRVLGKFAYPGDEWSEVGDHLYEFHGEVRRGSDAEPV